VTDPTRFEVDDDFAVIGRTFEEYRHFFALDPSDLVGERVLDCPGGVGSFVAEARDRGVRAVGADVLYETSPATLARRCRRDARRAAEQVAAKRGLFTWSFYDDPTERRRYLTRAHERFLRDYDHGRREGRYVPARLPTLPFRDDSFSLVLSAHLLFLYGDRLSHAFHLDALRDLARVATDEVRVFPVVGLDTEPYDQLDDLLDALAAEGYDPALRPVPFEFQRGATRMLTLSP
jgi:hypothetical protein